jgi:hypothetical protein
LPLSKNFILNLLQMSKDHEEVALSNIAAKNNIKSEQVYKLLHSLNEEADAKLEFNTNTIHIPQKLKAPLILKAIESGIDLDQIIELLHWRDFESFCLMVFEYHEFKNIQNCHFTQNRKRYEVDVVTVKEPLIFAIDAKKWKTGHAGALKTVVENHLNRIKDFSQYLAKPLNRQKFQLKTAPALRIIPLIITSKMYELQIFHGVPIIPFFKLNGFITELHTFLGSLRQFPIKMRTQRTLLSFGT